MNTKATKQDPPKYSANWTPIYPLRKVVEVLFCQSKYSRRGYGTNHFRLECGHDAFAKYSQGQPTHKRCRECWEIGAGVRITHA